MDRPRWMRRFGQVFFLSLSTWIVIALYYDLDRSPTLFDRIGSGRLNLGILLGKLYLAAGLVAIASFAAMIGSLTLAAHERLRPQDPNRS